MQPLISIVIANYNYGRFLEEAIQSVITQDGFDQCELIVVDGGSTDNSVEVIKKYVDRIAWWVSEKDKGQSDAFNKGFSHAKGRFLTWLNADDIFTKGAIRAILNLIDRHPEGEWFTGSSLWADENLVVTRCFCAHRFSVLRAKYATISVGGPSSFFSKRLYEAVGRIDESLHYMMDTDLWTKFYRQTGVRYVRTRHNVWAYRQHEESKMSGADGHDTEKAQANRARACAESARWNKIYGVYPRWLKMAALLLSYSIVDRFVAWWRIRNWKGHYATEV